jgi:hypothetical protein
MGPDLQERLLNSIENDRLVLFCGAGLSMSAPSHVPSAAELAKICRETYAKDYGAAIPEVDAQDLEKMAEYFSAKALLVPTFINKLLPRGPFLRAPNAGHYAIADFLATGIIDFAVSTNVDALTEVAAEDLGEGQAFVALDAAEANVPRLQVINQRPRATSSVKRNGAHDPLPRALGSRRGNRSDQPRGGRCPEERFSAARSHGNCTSSMATGFGASALTKNDPVALA